jgi:predicted nucleotidyltransferase
MNLSLSVAKTKAYGEYFHFPLTLEETHFWLISSQKVSKSAIKRLVKPLTDREKRQKQALLVNTQKKEKLAARLQKLMRFFPSILLLALTGSVAANNAKTGDDIDLLVVTKKNTLWLTRPFFLLLLSLLFKRRHPGDRSTHTTNSFCPNLWLDSSSLSIPKNRRNLYTAHEVLQVRPLYEKGQTHLLFVKENSWTRHYLANAYHALSRGKLKVKANNTFDALLALLNAIFFVFQYLYMSSKITSEKVSLHFAYFHKKDPSQSLSDHLANNSL